jgi:membrane fusion protein, copper/silver efflux system
MKQPGNKIIFVLCFLLAGITTGIASCENKKSITTTTSEKKQLWTCSMHPEIIRDHPGTCPICGMDLVKKSDDAAAINDIKLDELLQPADRFVVSSIPVTTIKRRAELLELDALGTIAYDTRIVNTISARISGRIEKLYVKYRYQDIRRGQKIMDIYSPQLLTTQQELLFLIQNDPGNIALINAARQKLLLLGMSENQLRQVISKNKSSLTVAVYSNYSGHIHDAGNTMPGTNNGVERMDISRITSELLIKEGMYVEKGQNIFQVYNMNRSWVLLNLFPEYAGLIKKGNPVMITPETSPANKFRARIDFIEPLYQKENKTLTARVFFNNARLMIPIGSQVRAKIFVNTQEANWIPRDAVLSLGMDKVVFLKLDGGFKAHKVNTGFEYKGDVQILSGLSATDSVAANAQFLTDSESFIKINKQP